MENRAFLDRVQGTPDRASKGAIESEGKEPSPLFVSNYFQSQAAK